MIEFIKTFGSLIVAVFAFFLSFYNLLKSRKHLSVHFYEFYELLMANKEKEIYILGYDGEKTYLKNVFKVSIDVINSSPIDIGFFNLAATDNSTNNDLEIITERELIESIDKSIYEEIHKIGRYLKIDIPKRRFGIFPSNQITHLDILVHFPNDYVPDNLTLRFQVAKESVLKKFTSKITKSKNSYEKFKTYKQTYDFSAAKKGNDTNNKAVENEDRWIKDQQEDAKNYSQDK